MSGYLGTSGKRLDHNGERVQFEQLTSDPATTETGDMWLRVDLAPEANQLATLRFDAGSSIWDIPVFEIGTSSTDVEEVYRIPIGGQIGYVPTAERSNASFSELSFSHNGILHGFHNDVELSAIPDSVVLQPASGDLSYFGGATSAFDINSNSPIFDGSLSLKFPTTSSGNHFIGSNSGLTNYPQIGKTHSVFVSPNDSSGSEDAAPFVFWGHSSESQMADGYALLYEAGADDLQLRRYDAGAETTLDSDSSPSYPKNGWLAYDVLHESDGALTVECYDATNETASSYRDGPLLTTLTATDSTHITSGSYDNQGIGFNSVRNTVEVADLWRTE